MPDITIGKYEAAEENLLAALKLYFEGAHLAPVHTLAAAANEVIEKLAEGHGVSVHIIPASRIAKVDKILRKKIFELLKKPQNFLKHADNANELACELNQIHTEFYLFEASRHLWLLRDSVKADQKVESMVIAAYYVMYFYIAVWPFDESGRLVYIINSFIEALSPDLNPLPISNDRTVWGEWYKDNIGNILTILRHCASSQESQSLITDFLGRPEIQSIVDELLAEERTRCGNT